MNANANISSERSPSASSRLRSIASRITRLLGIKVPTGRKEEGAGEVELKVAPSLCDPRKTSVDIGADQGSYSMVICSYSATCIAFEPRPAQAAMISNAARNKGLQIKVETVALSNSTGSARMRVLTMDPGRSTIDSANALEDPDGSPQASMSVPTRRLDDYDLGEVGFMKIDVEGHELAVLHGARNTLEKSKPNILIEVEERHHAGAINDVAAYLIALGYEGFFIVEGRVCPFAQSDKSIHQDPTKIGSWKQGWVRRGVYVNNFFFLPAGREAVLRAAVSSANLKNPLPASRS
jgi:FkbM family methyltransferase